MPNQAEQPVRVGDIIEVGDHTVARVERLDGDWAYFVGTAFQEPPYPCVSLSVGRCLMTHARIAAGEKLAMYRATSISAAARPVAVRRWITPKTDA